MKRIFRRFDGKLNILFALIIGGLSVCNIPNLSVLYVLHDEFGYWANAALAVGCDWSDIARMSPYYSYGYSLFLIPLFLIFRNSVLMYRAAIVLNAVMYVLSFFISLWCAGKLLPGVKKNFRGFICFIAALYGNNLLQANISWGEALLYLIFWILFATLLKYVENPRIRWIFCMGLEVVFLYVVHQRTLGVVAALAVTCILLFVQGKKNLWKKLPWKKILIIAGAVVLAGGAVVFLKHYVQGMLWAGQDDTLSGHNDYAGQFAKIIAIFTSLGGLQRLLYHLLGKFYGVLIGTCGLLVIFLKESLKRIFDRRAGISAIPYFFLLASFVMMLGVSSVFWLNGERLDGVVYSRYTEFIIGPVLVIAMGQFFSRQADKKMNLIYILTVLLCGFGVSFALKDKHTYTRIHNVVGGLFYDDAADVFQLLPCIAFLLFTGILICLAFASGRDLVRVAVMAAMAAVWIAAGRDALAKEVNRGQSGLKDLVSLTKAIETIDDDAPVYYLEAPVEFHYNRLVEEIQFLMPRKQIRRAEYDSLDTLEGDYFLIQFGTDGLELENYEIVTQAYGLNLFAPAGTALAAEVHIYQAEHPYRFSDAQMFSSTSGEMHKFVSNYEEGFVAVSQDLVLSSGKYEVIMTVKVSDIEKEEDPLADDTGDGNSIMAAEDEDSIWDDEAADIAGEADRLLGGYDVFRDSGRIMLNELTASQLDQGGFIKVGDTFEVSEAVSRISVRLYSVGNSRMKLESLLIRRVE